MLVTGVSKSFCRYFDQHGNALLENSKQFWRYGTDKLKIGFPRIGISTPFFSAQKRLMWEHHWVKVRSNTNKVSIHWDSNGWINSF